MKQVLTLILLLPLSVFAADIHQNTTISCISDISTKNGHRLNNLDQEVSADSTPSITQWQMKEDFGNQKSKIVFTWTPKTEKGPTITLETTDKPHNSINIRSKTEESLIVVSSTSNFYSAESWTFTLNFKIQSMVATRVQSNAAGVGGELITYLCDYKSTEVI